jgi:hypothetical protein
MVDYSALSQALDSSAEGVVDPSGMTPLDDILESTRFDSIKSRNGLVEFMLATLADLIARGPQHLKFLRQLIRRTNLSDRRLARAIETLLKKPPTSGDVDRRLWLSLSLMDIGFPRSVGSLRDDAELRKKYTGDWLTLVAANRNFSDVRTAFADAVRDDLITIPQLCLKAEVIRRQFGDRLVEFLKEMFAAYTDQRDREELAQSIKRMYGFDLSECVAAPGHPDTGSAQDWMSARTLAFFDKLEHDLSQRVA